MKLEIFYKILLLIALIWVAHSLWRIAEALEGQIHVSAKTLSL